VGAGLGGFLFAHIRILISAPIFILRNMSFRESVNSLRLRCVLCGFAAGLVA
jgi:hypothetical protein